MRKVSLRKSVYNNVIPTGIVGLRDIDFKSNVSVIRGNILACNDVTVDRASAIVLNVRYGTEESIVSAEARVVGDEDLVGRGHVECWGSQRDWLY